MSIDTGGAAFPVQKSETFFPELGMSLRDYIAVQAMEAVIGKMDSMQGTKEDHIPVAEQIARGAYTYADAMIAEKRRTEAGDAQ